MKYDDDNQQGGGFLDKNTIIAVVLSFLVFFGWQTYMGEKYPTSPGTKEPIATTTAVSSAENTEPEETKTSAPDFNKTKAQAVAVEPQMLEYNSENLKINFVNDGFGIQKMVLSQFSDREGQTIEYNSSSTAALLMATSINGQQNFNIKKISDNEFEGTLVSDQMLVTKRMVIDPQRYLIKTTVKVQFQQPQVLSLTNSISGQIEKVDKTLFLPAYEHQEFFVLTPEKSNREYLTLDTALAPIHYSAAQVAAFNGQYFALATINNSNLSPTAKVATDGKVGRLEVSYQTTEPKSDYEITYDFFFGPKKMELLSTISEPMEELIDYGMFSIIGRPLLAIMKVIYSFFSNWGVAIILLTILVKTVLFPLHMYSIKSMKKMQKIQPRLKELKEKYKSDPQRMNQETLLLMKTEKANPLSGCLPALMQIPIFIALYSMLGKSFELYKQPFFFWIHDLSTKDPYFVLPILAGAVFFLQQKLTPTVGMDPAQAKVMMFMPIMITAFMLTVPSGLALYMFINAVFSVFQQLIVMREKTT